MKECTKDKENINVPKFIKKDLMHIEFMRIIAIYLVLFNHTGKRGYALFTVAKENPMYWGNVIKLRRHNEGLYTRNGIGVFFYKSS